MPEYTIPPWIKPADTAAQFAHGLSLGAQIQQHSNALAQEAEQHAITLQARQQELDRAHQMEKHQLELQNQFKQEELGLRKSALAQEAEKTKLLTQRAAKQFAASQRVAKRIQSGEDEIKVMMEEGAMLYPSGTGAWMPGLAAESQRRKMVELPPTVEKFSGRDFLKVPNQSGGFSYHQLGEGVEERQLRMKALSDLHSDVRALENEQSDDTSGRIASSKPPSSSDSPYEKEIRNAYLERQKQINTMRKRLAEGYRTASVPQGEAVKSSTPSRGVYDPGSKSINWEADTEDAGDPEADE